MWLRRFLPLIMLLPLDYPLQIVHHFKMSTFPSHLYTVLNKRWPIRCAAIKYVLHFVYQKVISLTRLHFCPLFRCFNDYTYVSSIQLWTFSSLYAKSLRLGRCSTRSYCYRVESTYIQPYHKCVIKENILRSLFVISQRQLLTVLVTWVDDKS